MKTKRTPRMSEYRSSYASRYSNNNDSNFPAGLVVKGLAALFVFDSFLFTKCSANESSSELGLGARSPNRPVINLHAGVAQGVKL